MLVIMVSILGLAIVASAIASAVKVYRDTRF